MAIVPTMIVVVRCKVIRPMRRQLRKQLVVVMPLPTVVIIAQPHKRHRPLLLAVAVAQQRLVRAVPLHQAQLAVVVVPVQVDQQNPLVPVKMPLNMVNHTVVTTLL